MSNNHSCSEENLEIIKQASHLDAYVSFSKSVRRTAIIEASKVIEKEQKKEGRKNDKEKCKRRNNQRVNSR